VQGYVPKAEMIVDDAKLFMLRHVDNDIVKICGERVNDHAGLATVGNKGTETRGGAILKRIAPSVFLPFAKWPLRTSTSKWGGPTSYSQKYSGNNPDVKFGKAVPGSRFETSFGKPRRALETSLGRGSFGPGQGTWRRRQDAGAAMPHDGAVNRQ